MRDRNEVDLTGNLGQDVELRYTNNTGEPVVNLSLATSKVRVVDGEEVKKTQWHRIVVFGKHAENCHKYLKKGSRIRVKGELQYDKYVGKDGVERLNVQIKSNDVEFLKL